MRQAWVKGPGGEQAGKKRTVRKARASSGRRESRSRPRMSLAFDQIEAVVMCHLKVMRLTMFFDKFDTKQSKVKPSGLGG